jgi:NhaP-type Na+/H+ or K+/H+ antiporter
LRQQVPEFLDKAKHVVWSLVELAFAAVLAIMLIYLLVGQNSGTFVLSVADNVLKFANAVPTASLVGLVLLAALIYLIARRRR